MFGIQNDKKRIKLILLAATAILIIIILGIWTSMLKKSRETDEIRLALEEIISERGEKGLFDLAGIPTESMSYDGSDLYIGSRGAWTMTEEERASVNAYEKAKESVVQIISRESLSDESQASGVIISSDGYIVTNKHVLGNASGYKVNFYDGSSSDAFLVGADALTDLAVIKTARTDLKAISYSDHEAAIGSRALSIGNPYGYTWSLSEGIISGLDRTIFAEDIMIPGLIQSDNFINPGNSGGPLLDSRGDMIGLVSSIYTTTGSAQGLAFSIPTETVKRVSSELIKNKAVKRGIVDAYLIELNPQLVSYMNLGVSEGLLVSHVEDGGNAEKAGIRGGSEAAEYDGERIYLGGDVIVSLNGFDISGYSDYFRALFGTSSGERVKVSLYRNGRRINTEVVLSEYGDESMRYIIR